MDEHLRRWIGCANEENLKIQPWPPRGPDLTSSDYFLWGYVKDRDFVPPLHVDINDLKQRITNALATVDRNMLIVVCEQNSTTVLKSVALQIGAHIKHL